MASKKAPEDIPVNMYDYPTLVQKTIQSSIRLMEYFRMNLIYYQLVSGKGLEFDRLREYVPGHDPRRIDWKKFAQTGKLYTRVFKEERHFDIIIVLDVSNSMLLGTTEMTKNEYAAIVAGALAFAAVEAGDSVGVVMTSDRVRVATDPSSEFYKLLSVIADKDNYGGNKDWTTLSRDLLSNYQPESIVFLVSDFIDTNAELFLPELASNFSKTYGIMVRDPIDNELPRGVGRMYLKGAGNEKLYLSNIESAREEYALLARRQIKRVRDTFHEYGQLFFEITTKEDFGTGFIKALGSEEVIVT